MAQLALRFPIFLASPSDVLEERNLAENLIIELSREAAKRRILLEPLRWERDAAPGIGAPNDITLQLLKISELVIVILWSRLGTPSRPNGKETGTLEEFRVAWERVRQRTSDNLYLYCRTSQPAAGSDLIAYQQVQEFREQLEASKQVYLITYTTTAEFGKRLERDLRDWLTRWNHVPEICEYALENSPPTAVPPTILGASRLNEAEKRIDLGAHWEISCELGRIATSQFQRHGAKALDPPIPIPASKSQRRKLTALYSLATLEQQQLRHHLSSLSGALPFGPTPLRLDPNGEIFFFGEEWFHFFCGLGLLDAIKKDRLEAVERYPYFNAAHQYLSALATRDLNRKTVVNRLIRWLSSTTAGTKSRPLARNFAAYVLGMVGAHEAEDALADALDDEGEDVALYSICALGKIRSRRYFPKLVEHWFASNDERERLAISQAICRSTRIADYQL